MQRKTQSLEAIIFEPWARFALLSLPAPIWCLQTCCPCLATLLSLLFVKATSQDLTLGFWVGLLLPPHDRPYSHCCLWPRGLLNSLGLELNKIMLGNKGTDLETILSDRLPKIPVTFCVGLGVPTAEMLTSSLHRSSSSLRLLGDRASFTRIRFLEAHVFPFHRTHMRRGVC